MTIAATIGFLLVGFMFTAIIIKLAALIWSAMVKNQDRYYFEREFWDENDSFETEITAETLTAMGTHHIPVEMIAPEVRYGS